MPTTTKITEETKSIQFDWKKIVAGLLKTAKPTIMAILSEEFDKLIENLEKP